jgi:hypothetical protein
MRQKTYDANSGDTARLSATKGLHALAERGEIEKDVDGHWRVKAEVPRAGRDFAFSARY